MTDLEHLIRFLLHSMTPEEAKELILNWRTETEDEVDKAIATAMNTEE